MTTASTAQLNIIEHFQLNLVVNVPQTLIEFSTRHDEQGRVFQSSIRLVQD